MVVHHHSWQDHHLSMTSTSKSSTTAELAAVQAAASLQNALLQSARPLPFSINNILHQVRFLHFPQFHDAQHHFFLHFHCIQYLISIKSIEFSNILILKIVILMFHFWTKKDEKEPRDDSPSPRNESNNEEDDEEIDEASDDEEEDVKIEPKTEDFSHEDANAAFASAAAAAAAAAANQNPFLLSHSQDLLAAISSGMRLPAPPPGAITATPHRPSPFVPTSSAFGSMSQLGGAAGGNPAAVAAAAAAADYASWLCRPLAAAGLPSGGTAAGPGYLPLPANILAARLGE